MGRFDGSRGKKEPPPDYTVYRKLPKDFAGLVKEARELNSDIKTLKARKDEISEALAAGMIVAKAKSVSVDGAAVTYCVGRNSRIDGRKLLEEGVSSDVIVKCTVVTEYPYVTVGSGGGADE